MAFVALSALVVMLSQSTPERKAIMGPPPLPSPSTPSSSSSSSTALVLRTPPSAMQVDIKPDVKPVLRMTPSSSSRAAARRPSTTPTFRRRSSATPSPSRPRAMTTTPTSASSIRARLASLAPKHTSPDRPRQAPTFPVRSRPDPTVIEDADDEETAFWQPSRAEVRARSGSGGTSREPIVIDCESEESSSFTCPSSSSFSSPHKDDDFQLIPSPQHRNQRPTSSGPGHYDRAESPFSEASFGSASDFRRASTFYDFDPRYGRHVPSVSSGFRQARDDQLPQLAMVAVPRTLVEAVSRLTNLLTSLKSKTIIGEDNGSEVVKVEVISPAGKINLVSKTFMEEDMSEGRSRLVRSLLDDPAVKEAVTSPPSISRLLTLLQVSISNALKANVDDYKSSGKGTRAVRQGLWFQGFVAGLEFSAAEVKDDLGREEIEVLLYALRKVTDENDRPQTIMDILSDKLENVDIATFRRISDAIRELCIEVVGLVWIA
ncbi:hypothetical protein IAT40_002024 [Kwoniella sp. CBS 6097]